RNSSQMMEQIALRHPGDKIDITYMRNGSPHTSRVTLKSRDDFKTTSLSSSKSYKDSTWDSWLGESDVHSDDLGLELSDISDEFKEKYNIKNGVLVNKINPNSTLRQFTNIKDGFLITKINGQNVNSAQEA